MDIWAGIVTSMNQIGGVAALPFVGPAIDTFGRRIGMVIGGVTSKYWPEKLFSSYPRDKSWRCIFNPPIPEYLRTPARYLSCQEIR